MQVTESQKIIMRFEMMSQKYHKLSLLFYELSQSMKIKSKELGEHNTKLFKEYVKSLDLDIDKIRTLSLGLSNLTLKDIQKEEIQVNED